MKTTKPYASYRRRALRTGFWTGIGLGTTIGLVAMAVLPLIALVSAAVGVTLYLFVKTRNRVEASYGFARDAGHAGV